MHENAHDRAAVRGTEERTPSGGAIVVERRIDAPRELVWRAWTEPERMKRWWGPAGFSAPVIETDPRPGGRYLWGMRSPDGQDSFTTGVFREVEFPRRFVVTESFADASGSPVQASRFGLPGDWPDEIVMTVTLEERDGGTAMTVREEGVPVEIQGPAEAGLRQSIEKLARSVSGSPEGDAAGAGEAPQAPAPDPRLRRLDPYVGIWRMEGREAADYGEIRGTLRFEWMEGGHFLVQHVDLDHAGRPVKGIEVIGYGRDWEGNAPQDCTSHFFDNEGNHFVYIYEVGEDGTITIWGGFVGSPAAFRGRFGADGATITGRWDWPGGGYDAVMTRVG